jgi:thiol-disulfide isomerase/thioredoxin
VLISEGFMDGEKEEFAQMKRSLSVQSWIRCVMGVALMLGVVGSVTGWNGSFGRFPFVHTVRAQEYLTGAFHPAKPDLFRMIATKSQPALADEGPLPDFGGAVAWLNSAPLSGESLRGKVVLVNFWTYSCINSLRELPYMKSWAAKYKDAGLVVIGVHAPEFELERKRANVENAVRNLKVTYPVAIDSEHRIWQAFNNEYWPADYFIDGSGRATIASPSMSFRSFSRQTEVPA